MARSAIRSQAKPNLARPFKEWVVGNRLTPLCSQKEWHFLYPIPTFAINLTILPHALKRILSSCTVIRRHTSIRIWLAKFYIMGVKATPMKGQKIYFLLYNMTIRFQCFKICVLRLCKFFVKIETTRFMRFE